MFARLALAGGALALLALPAMAAPKPRPATALAIVNARAVPATEVSVSAGDAVANLPKPLAPKGRATLKLPKLTGCMVAVSAVFADETVAEIDEFDVCKEKQVRFTD